MKFIFLILSSLLLLNLTSCDDFRNEKVNYNRILEIEQNVINDIFLKSLDTPFYPYYDFILLDSTSKQTPPKFNLIAVSNKLKPIENSNLFLTLSKNDFGLNESEYFDDFFIFDKKDTVNHELILDKITNIGKFKIVKNYDFNQKVNSGVIGSFQFSRITFSKDKNAGFLLITSKDSSKNSIERFILVNLIDGKWKIKKSIILSYS
ncbi:hypothetical protein [Sediminibacterium sp. C3]|uniref:hypothetical protein n=1 Tax=Sediminibacterium sp. C3 TaxID=1267211 RepID=UPI00040AC2D5|nr:hypothetical protein [Sediminibacterium sp. C3]